MKSADIIKILEEDGWVRYPQKGIHCQYKHPIKQGKVYCATS